MKKEQNENIEVVAEVEATEVAEEVVKESKVKKIASKTGKFIKKHGLKIVAGAGAVAGVAFLVVKTLRKGDENAAIEYLGESDDYACDDDVVENSDVTTEE